MLLPVCRSSLPHVSPLYVLQVHHILLVPVVVLFTFRFVLVSAIQPSTFSPHAHYDLNGIMMLSSGYKYTLSILIFIAWVRLLKFMLAIQQIGILVRVLFRIAYDLMPVVVLWVLIWAGFSITFYCTYGDQGIGMESWPMTLLFLWRLLLEGEMEAVQEMALHDGGDIVGVFYYFMASALITLILLNVIVAIMVTSYQDLLKNAQLQCKLLHASLTMSFYTNLNTKASQDQSGTELQAQSRNRQKGSKRAKMVFGSLGWFNKFFGTKIFSAKIFSAETENARAGKEIAKKVCLAAAFQRWLDNWERETRYVQPTQQLQGYLEDESLGLRVIQSKFLPQMESAGFGTPLEKLRYLRRVFKQCKSVAQSMRWLVQHGHRMTTPESDQVIQKVSLRFPEIAEEELLALLHVYETATAITAVLRSERQPTRYELSRIQVARSNAQQRLSVRLADLGDQEVRGWKSLRAN